MTFSFGGEDYQNPTGIVAFMVSLNIFLSITATLGNALILVALRKESSLHPPTKLLFRCLAVTDICVGLISQPLLVTSLMSDITTGMNANILIYIGHIKRTSSFILCGVSVFTSTAISVDRLLALLLGLRYRLVVTLRNVRAVIICFWLIGVSLGSMYLWNSGIAFTVFVAFAVLSLVISISCYAKIYLKLRQHHAQLQDRVYQGQPNGGGILLNIARYKKSVSSVLWVQLAFVACYVPFVIMVMLMTYGRIQMIVNTFEFAFTFTATLTYLNSSLNPILYCWKIRSVRQAVKDTINSSICCTSA